MSAFTVLVMARAPVPGQAKTRLGAEIGHDRAAALATAALIDTLAACRAAGAHTMVALAGRLADCPQADTLARAMADCAIVAQEGAGFAERLVHAHRIAGPGLVVQIGMDTPQVTAADLFAVAAKLSGHDAVLAPATDGGWWALARREPAVVQPLAQVAMSTPTTGLDTRAALEAAGHRVAIGHTFCDVDTGADAQVVAAAAPGTRFARLWRDGRLVATS